MEGCLDLSGNRLSSLPASFTSIEIGEAKPGFWGEKGPGEEREFYSEMGLDLSQNRLMTLPEDWASLKVKGTVNLDGNPGSFVWRGYLREAFDVLDRDGDGVLNKDEFRHLVRINVMGWNTRNITAMDVNDGFTDALILSRYDRDVEGNVARQREYFKLDENDDLSRDAFVRCFEEGQNQLSDEKHDAPLHSRYGSRLSQRANHFRDAVKYYWR